MLLAWNHASKKMGICVLKKKTIFENIFREVQKLITKIIILQE